MDKLDQRIAELAWSGRTEAAVVSLIDLMNKRNGSKWLPVGGRENNAGIINVSTSPGGALVERITNAADALLELAYELNPIAVTSPVTAAAHYFGVPAEGIGGMSEAARRALGEKNRVSLEDSGVEARPTVVVTDLGIGQTAQALPHTILSLGESNKLSSLHLMGSYNQGGSASLSFSRATIIVARRHPQLLDGEDDGVAVTVVEQHDDPSKKVPNYEYLTDATGEIVTLDPALFPELVHGARIIHVQYDLQIKGPWTTQPYYFVQAALPSMPLPFVLGGTRTKPKDPPGDRVILGNAARLDNAARARGEIEVPHKDTHDIDLGDKGSVRIKYWVVMRPAGSTSKSDPTASYVEASNAISLTLNGQRQDFEARSWINNKAKLPFIYRHIIVQIEADGLSRQAKKELFASTRERARQSDVRTEIYDTLAEVLREDEELQRLNEEERERLLRKSSDAVNEKVRRKLGKWIKHILKDTERPGHRGSPGSGSGSGDYKPKHGTGGGKPGRPRDTDDSHLPEVPTYLHFARESLTVIQGGRSQLWVEIDAKNDYLPNHNDELTITVEGPGDGKVRVATRSAMTAGRSRWLVQADADAPVGDYKLTATLGVGDTVLTASLPVTVKLVPPAKKGDDPGTEPDTGPNVVWVTRDNWPEGFTEFTVGRVAETDASTDIMVNRDYQPLVDSLSGGLTEAQVKSHRDRYQFPVACALWLQKYQLNQLPENDPGPGESWLDGEMQRMAEAVLLAISPDVELEGQREDAT
jgi:hypothetical protein